MKTTAMALCAGLLACTVLSTDATSAPLGLSSYGVDLGKFVTIGEASTITYNWDTGHLLVGGDENNWQEISKDGTSVQALYFPGYNDTESVAYVGNGQYVVGQERNMKMSQISQQHGFPDYYTGESAAPFFFIAGGAQIGNQGLEGLAYDRATGNFYAVKETNPQKVWLISDVTFDTSDDGGTGTVTELFDASLLGLLGLSDIALLENGNLLIVSALSDMLLEVTLDGQIVGSLDLKTVDPNVTFEGVTVDEEGNIYLVGEAPFRRNNFYRLVSNVVAIPEPATAAMMIAGLGLMALGRRKAEDKAAAA